ncbi:type VII secretion target [Nocardia xishanensis]
MGNPGDIAVDPGGMRDHAAKVDAVLEGLSMAREAAEYLAHADDGYGTLVGPYARSILNPLHDRITERLRVVTEDAEELPPKLRFAADSFQNLDEGRKNQTDRQREQIEQKV